MLIPKLSAYVLWLVSPWTPTTSEIDSFRLIVAGEFSHVTGVEALALSYGRAAAITDRLANLVEAIVD